MNLKVSFDDCMSMLGCLSILVIFFSVCGYVCYMSLFENTIGIWGWLIGTILLVVLVLIAFFVPALSYFCMIAPAPKSNGKKPRPPRSARTA